jgi:hypothetical protein
MVNFSDLLSVVDNLHKRDNLIIFQASTNNNVYIVAGDLIPQVDLKDTIHQLANHVQPLHPEEVDSS